MSTMSYRTAKRVSKSCAKIDMQKLNTAVSYLKIDPNLPNRQLRNLLMDAVQDEHMDSQLLCNFKRRACICNVKNPDLTELTFNKG